MANLDDLGISHRIAPEISRQVQMLFQISADLLFWILVHSACSWYPISFLITCKYKKHSRAICYTLWTWSFMRINCVIAAGAIILWHCHQINFWSMNWLKRYFFFLRGEKNMFTYSMNNYNQRIIADRVLQLHDESDLFC